MNPKTRLEKLETLAREKSAHELKWPRKTNQSGASENV